MAQPPNQSVRVAVVIIVVVVVVHARKVRQANQQKAALMEPRPKKRRRNRGPRPDGVSVATAGVPIDHTADASLPVVDLAPISTWREID
jgi:hypothetical protein